MGELKCSCGACKTCRARQRMAYIRTRRRGGALSKRQEILDQAHNKEERKAAMAALLRGEPVTIPPPMPRRRRSLDILEELRTTANKLAGLVTELLP